jgi:hypothetical protein
MQPVRDRHGRRRGLAYPPGRFGRTLDPDPLLEGTGELSAAVPLGADGIAFARSGAVFAAVNAQSTIVRVGEAGITTIADAEEGINGASAVAFGTRSDRRNLSVVNFGVFSPALLKIAVGVRGAPGQ